MTPPGTTTVGAVLERIDAGRSLKTLERPAGLGELGILKVSAVTWGDFRPNENKAMPLGYEPGACPRAMNGDILISRANTRELVGAPVMVKGDHPNLLLSDKTLKLVPNVALVEPSYLVRALRAPAASKHFAKCAGGTSGSMTNITQSDIRAAPLWLPSLSEQRRIAALLDKADALRAKRREAIAKLDQLLQSVFLDSFGHPLANEKSWPLARIGDVCSPKQWPTITGKQLESSGYPVYGANGAIGFYSSFNHEIPTVLVTCRGATCGTINVCEARSYVTGNAMALNNLDATKIELEYMATMLRMRGVGEAITGAAQPQITREKLSPVLIPLPPLSEQTRFSRTSKAIADRRATLQQHAHGLDRLFASTQHRAFTGTL